MMSSNNSKNLENTDFIERFIEICGTSQPSEIARLLNVSYQAAKNYLQGRLPDSAILKTISEKTPYSINWLLTGEGQKFVGSKSNDDTVRLTDQMRAFIRKECLAIIGELLENQKEDAPTKVFVLTSENIKEEKIMDKPVIFSEKQQ